MSRRGMSLGKRDKHMRDMSHHVMLLINSPVTVVVVSLQITAVTEVGCDVGCV